MMSLFGPRRDRPTTTSRHPRHAKPQVEGLERIIALDGAGGHIPHHLHHPPHVVSPTPVTVTNRAEATSTQNITQTGSTVNVTLEKGNFKGATIIIDANTLNTAVQTAKVNANATTTVAGAVEVHGHKKVPAAVTVVNTANASNTQNIDQSGSTVNVTLEKGNFKGVTLIIKADTINKASQTADVNANATTSVGKK